MTPFLTGFLQVLLVSANTVFLGHGFTPGVAVAGYLISLVWTYNVRAALGDWKQRQAYCLGAMSGGLMGMKISKMIVKSLSAPPENIREQAAQIALGIIQ